MNSPTQSRFALLRDLYRQYPRQVAAASILLLASSLAEAVGLVSIIPLIQQLIQGAPAETSGSWVESSIQALFASLHLPYNMGSLLAFITLAMLLKGLFQWLAWRQAGATVGQVVTAFRLGLVANLFRADWSFFTRHKIGKLANALGQETLGAAQAYLAACRFIAASSLVLVYVIAVAVVAPMALGFVLMMGLVLLLPVRGLLRYTSALARDELQTQQRFVSHLTNTIASIRPIRAMGAQDEFETLAQRDADELRVAVSQLTSVTYQMRVLQEPTMVLCIAVATLIGRNVLGIEIPTLMLIGFAMWRIGFHVNVANNGYREMLALEPMYWSLQKTIASAGHAREHDGGTQSPPGELYDIQFQHVQFAYPETPVYDSLDLHMAAGSVTALTGESGAGKSTLIDLLLGLQKPDTGQITVNAVPLDAICIEQWRQTIGYVPQEITLFHGTVMENVCLGNSSIDKARVKQALVQANAWDFVQSLPEGIDTLLGEQGAQISGGQRQRIAIARALVRQPGLLILDEYTASMDKATQQNAIELLETLRGSMTILIATHQSEVMAAADIVYRVGEGRATPEKGN